MYHMMKQLRNMFLEGFTAIAIAMLLIGLPRISAGFFAGSVLLPAFVAWWVLSYRSAIPNWWMALIIVLVDMFTFSPRGGLTASFVAPSIALVAMDSFFPLSSFLAASVRAAIAVGLFDLSAASILFARLAPVGAAFPWKAVATSALEHWIASIVLIALLWNYRKRRPWLW